MHNCARIHRRTTTVLVRLAQEKEAEASACILNLPHFHLLGQNLMRPNTAHALPAPTQALSVRTLQQARVQLDAVVLREPARAQQRASSGLVAQQMTVQPRVPLRLRTQLAPPKPRVRHCLQAQPGTQSQERSL